jgi:hypothetical protein
MAAMIHSHARRIPSRQVTKLPKDLKLTDCLVRLSDGIA